MIRSALLGLCLLAGCTSITLVGGESSGGEVSEDGSTSILNPTGSPPVDPSTSALDSSSSGDAADTGGPTGGFLNPETDTSTYCSVVGDSFECSLTQQDCCSGEACKPWANDGGSMWNAQRCTPVPDDAGQAGEPCNAEGSAVSGVDTCDVGLMCWGVDDETLEGECYALCTDGDEEPTCADPARTCLVANEGALPICLVECDPLQPQCADGAQCRLAPGSELFVCIPELISLPCPAGSIELNPDAIVGCSPAEPCCAAVCDLTSPESCLPGDVCVPLPGVPNENVGYCQPEA